LNRQKVISLRQKHCKILADADDSTPENRMKRTISVNMIEVIDLFLEE
jgi:hypothetical protein